MRKEILTLLLGALWLLSTPDTVAQTIDRQRAFHVAERFDAYYAMQGVAIGKKHFYAIVKGHKLYTTHSNYPEVPMASSIEIFDTRTMQHIQSISLGIDIGSCVWVTPGKNCWYAFFAHYAGSGKEPGKDVTWSQLVKFDRKWRRMQAWVLPKTIIEELHPHSLSGGVLVDEIFYCMGHDNQKCYLMQLPRYGVHLEWVGTIEVPIPGQAIDIDKKGNIWGISRKHRQVIKASQK